MKVGYTEFSFGYAFTENLIRSSPTAPVGAPVFPNLVQEGASGFDIRINFPAVPLFPQYKLPEVMRRGTAFETKWGCPGLSLPFFRIAMMRRDISRQHELLIELETRYPSSVFYAAPALENIRSFDIAYNRAEVARRSVFFSPTDIGPLRDDKVHTIAYKPGLQTGYFFSEPRPIKSLTFDHLSNIMRSAFENPRFNTLQVAAREMRESVVDLASPAIREVEHQVAERVNARRRPIEEASRSQEEEQTLIDVAVAREIARIDFGIDLVIAQPRQ